MLGQKAASSGLQIFVNAFHGWEHNHLCQLKYHPLYRTGTGLEDLETLERIFSASNSVARIIRSATSYHWLQAIDLHFRQWDDEKYQQLGECDVDYLTMYSFSSGTFLLGNYEQALEILKDYVPEVNVFKLEKGVSNMDIEGWITAEREFLDGLKDEPQERVLTSAYVEALIFLKKAE